MATESKLPFSETFRAVRLTTKSGDEYDFTGLVQELSIYEDLFSNVLTGEAVVADGQGAADKLSLSGGERLTVELVVAGDISIHDFFCYAVTDRRKANMSSEVYKLKFVSFEQILNENTRCYSAIQGTNGESVRKIFKSYIGSEKAFKVEPTVGNFKFVMPSWSPFEAINWYAGRSTSANTSGSYFLFWETLNGFNFRAVETAIQDSVKAEYHYSPVTNQTVGKDVSNIREYEVISQGDVLSASRESNTTLWTDDLIRKKIQKTRYEADDSKHTLQDNKLVSFDKNAFGVGLKERRDVFGSETIYRPETRNVHTQTRQYTFGSIQPKLSGMRQMQGLKVRFLAHGQRTYSAGDVIKLDFQQSRAITQEDKQEARDNVLSGKYLVTAIHYLFKPQDFHMSVEAVKDSTRD